MKFLLLAKIFLAFPDHMVPCRWVGGLVGGCGARPVSRKTAIYFIALYAVLLLNLLFTLFCREISCGEKLSPKVHLWKKMTNIRSVSIILKVKK